MTSERKELKRGFGLKHSKVKSWEKHEAAIASSLDNGKRVRGSGCSRRASRKSDVLSDLVRVECKNTDKKSITIEEAYLYKIMNEAGHTRLPGLSFGFGEHLWLGFPADIGVRLCNIAYHLRNGQIKRAIEEAESLL